MPKTFNIVDMVLEASETTSVWSATIRITDPSDYMATMEGDQVTLTVGGEDYLLVVLTKSINRSSPASIDMRVTAASPLVLKDAPRANPQSYLYDVPKTAREIVEDILGGTVTWNLVDWLIPAGRVQFQDVVPLEAARRVVEAAGGVILSNKDGSIVVQSEFPIATNFYATATPDHVFTDDSDNLSATENYDFREQYNQFRISEVEVTQGDRLEWVPDEDIPLQGIVRLYPSPWRTTVTVRTTEDAPSTVYNLTGVVSRQEEEEVEFREGTASLSYPLSGTPVIQWLSVPLGGVSYALNSVGLTAPKTVNGGYGLAKVTYQVDAIEYAVLGVDGTSVQFIAEEI